MCGQKKPLLVGQGLGLTELVWYSFVFVETDYSKDHAFRGMTSILSSLLIVCPSLPPKWGSGRDFAEKVWDYPNTPAANR